MSWSCYIGRNFSSGIRGPLSGYLNKRLPGLNCSAFIPRQSHHHTLPSGECKNNASSVHLKHDWKSSSLLGFPKPFSTSSRLLAQHKHHDHSKLWTFERVLSAALLPLVPVALVYPSQPLDTALALVIVLHTHLGLEAIVVDYIRPILFGEMAPKIGLGLLYLFSIVTLAGLLNLIYNDTGLANTLIAIWKM